MNDSLIEELLEATYGFCIKHISDPNDAEDLTQEILCEALAARDKKINNFYGWFWQMARNRISRFYRLKQHGAVLLDEYINVPYEALELDSELLKQEQISELNYNISRLSSLHRSVIIMHYLQNMSVSDIAKELDIPIGSVKRRLYDARNDIKKGMENMMNYGRASYAPAEVQLWGAYGIPSYWHKINGTLEKQLFACCAFKARSIKEIADEIGCAPVYFEDKLLELVNDKFIKETSNGKYLLDFCLIPAQASADNGYEISVILKDLGREMTELIKENEKTIRSLDFYGNDMPFGELLWFLYYVFADGLQQNMLLLNEHLWKDKVEQSNGKNYRIAGIIRMPDETVVSKESAAPNINWSNLHSSFMTTNYSWMQYGNIFQAQPFGDRDGIFGEATADLFMRIFEKPDLTLSENERFNAASLIRSGFLKEKNNCLYPTMPIMCWDTFLLIRELSQKLTKDIAKQYYERINEVCSRNILPHIRTDLLEEYAHWILGGSFFTLGYLYGYAMKFPEESGLTLPTDYNNTGLATYITYKK